MPLLVHHFNEFSTLLKLRFKNLPTMNYFEKLKISWQKTFKAVFLNNVDNHQKFALVSSMATSYGESTEGTVNNKTRCTSNTKKSGQKVAVIYALRMGSFSTTNFYCNTFFAGVQFFRLKGITRLKWAEVSSSGCYSLFEERIVYQRFSQSSTLKSSGLHMRKRNSEVEFKTAQKEFHVPVRLVEDVIQKTSMP